MMDIELKKHPETRELIPEEWREIDGYDGWYEVSNYGRVRSWKKTSSKHKSSNPTMMRANPGLNGYPAVHLYNKGSEKRKYVHRLVASAFIDSSSNRNHVNHLDGNKENNFYLNLEWSTPKENIAHACSSGLRNGIGETNGRSKLTEDQIEKIRSRYSKGGVSQSYLAEGYGVSQTLISKIVNNEIWSHI